MVSKPAPDPEEEAFVDSAEKPRVKPLTVKALTGLPPWKLRNREPKHIQIMLRASESQRALLQAASEHQEKSQQKILEEMVWPILEEQYGISSAREDHPS